MKKELIIRSNSDAVDFAMLNEGRLIELDKEVGKNKFSVGDIFVAKIRKTIPGLNAAFVFDLIINSFFTVISIISTLQ